MILIISYTHTFHFCLYDWELESNNTSKLALPPNSSWQGIIPVGDDFTEPAVHVSRFSWSSSG